MRRRIDRRTLLRGLGGAAIALPLLESMGCAPGDGSTSREDDGATGTSTLEIDGVPKRLVIFFTRNGTVRPQWDPTGTETSFTMAHSPILSPLEAWKSKLIVMSGVDLRSATSGSGDFHTRGCGSFLTGVPTIPNGASGMTVDQHIASYIRSHGTRLKFDSQQLAIGDSPLIRYERLNWLGANRPLGYTTDPRQAFNALFGDASASAAQRATELAQRLSVLDGVTADYREIVGRLSGDDRQRVQQHLDAINQLEASLRTVTPATSACTVPTLTATGLETTNPDNMPAVANAQMDLATMSLACDLTRVITLDWRIYALPWLGVHTDHHTLSHTADSLTQNIADLVTINHWYATQFASFLHKLDSVREGSGTLLDNTLVLWCSDINRGPNGQHCQTDIPMVLAGNAGGYLRRRGRYLRGGSHDVFSQSASDCSTPHNALLVSLCNAMGLPDTTYGTASYGRGPMAGLQG